MTILNLTQHPASSDQLEAGVVDLPPTVRAQLRQLLTFDSLPDTALVSFRARTLAALAAAHAQPPGGQCMIGGAPYLMAPLTFALRSHGLTPVFAFSVRESTEERQPDGSVAKRSVFRHIGFVAALDDDDI